MKASIICNCYSLFYLAVLCNIVFFDITLADTGGGSGIPTTPYCGDPVGRKDWVDADVDTVKKLKEYSSKHKGISYIKVKDNKKIFDIRLMGFAYVKSGHIDSNIKYAFVGKNKRYENITIDLSEVENFRILSQENDVLLLEITSFPAISPKEIVKLQPTYLELITNYKFTTQLRLPLRSESGARIYIVGKTRRDEYMVRMPIVSMEDIDKGQLIKFNTEGVRSMLWWAIPSVATDPAYPHRTTYGG